MQHITTRQLALAAVTAALYTVLSYFANIFGLAFGTIQCRFSEALCVLPFFFPGTTWGLFIGCLLTNLISAYGPIDIVFGSLATLLAALATSHVKHRALAPLPPVIFNGVIVGAVIAYSEVGATAAFWPAYAYNALTLAVGELLACYVLGSILLAVLPRIPFFRAMIPAGRLGYAQA